MIKGIWGVNIAVKNLEASVAKYEKLLGIEAVPSAPGAFAYPGLRGAKFIINGFRLNLITSDDPATGVGRFLEKRGEGVFLISAEVDDLDAQVATLKDAGIPTVLEPSAEGNFGKVNFVHPKELSGVQFELLQPAT